MRDRIEIDKEMIPYQFDITLAEQPFTISADYNKAADLFTVSLYDSNGMLLSAGEPLIYGRPLFQDVYRSGKFPALDLVPLDESGHDNAVTWDNFGKTVFLTIDDEGD